MTVLQRDGDKAVQEPSSSVVVRSLSSRLSLALIALVVVLGIAVMSVSQSWMRAYYEELTQKLNINIAMYVTDEYALLNQQEWVPDTEVIADLAHHAMIINPLAEVYLLDPAGQVIAYRNETEADALPLARTQVPLAPVRAFLDGNIEFPLRGADPRNADVDKVFSVAELRNGDQLQGYLYVVLGGQVYDGLEDSVGSSYSRVMVLICIGVIILAAILVGILIFNLLVRRVTRLSNRMQQFSQLELTTPLPEELQPSHHDPRDEVDLLSQRFEQMSSQISWQLEQLREGDAMRRELISNVSHDLRTPLSTIQGYLETLLIKNDQLDEQHRLAYLRTAIHSSNRLARLIGDLFELSKLESTHMQLQCEQFSLAELVYDIIGDFHLQAEAKEIRVSVTNQQQNALVIADISLMQRVFENLLRNAIAYTPEGGEIEVVLESVSLSGRIGIAIRDNGCGISAEDLPHIFDRFYISADSRTHAGSTGLGLAIVKRILDLHHSDIQVESQLQQGACFRFSLPRAA